MVRTWVALTFLAPASLATASLATATPVVVSKPDALPKIRSAPQSYVLGRFAASVDELPTAVLFFDAANRLAPAEPELKQHGFEVALGAGDRAVCIALAHQLAAGGSKDSTIALVRMVDALGRSDWKMVDRLRPELTGAGYAQVVGPLIEAWAAFARSGPDTGLALLDYNRFSGIGRSYVFEQRAHMLAAAGRWEEAAAAYHELLAGSGVGINWLRVGEADALQQSGKLTEVRALFAANPDDVPLAAARGRFAAGKRIGALAPDAARAIAWMSSRLAADLSREKPVPLALVFGRVATFLDPKLDAAWLITGDILARNGKPEAALAAYANVEAGSPMQRPANIRRAQVLSEFDRPAAGLLLRAAAARPDASIDDWTRLGDYHRAAKDITEAANAYGRAIALLTPAQTSEAIWPLYFLRGSMRAEAGDWAVAEPDLRKALAHAPDQPIVLNYLGYSMIERGVSLAEAQSLIERAAQISPDNGSILDSLGWAYFQTGQFERAVTALERAADELPGEATVNAHLGDAYWRAGRRVEARFRWRAARDLDPEPEQKRAILAKLDFGLDVALTQLALPLTVNPTVKPKK